MSDARSTRSNLLTRAMRGGANTLNGISFAWDGDWYHVSGTATGDIGWRQYWSSDIPVKAGRTYTLSIDFDGDVPDGYSRLALQLFTDVKRNVYTNVALIYRSRPHVTFTAPDGDYERLQLWGPIIKGGATVDLRVRCMLVEGDTPAAWAPAEGETLAGGGALMSANLWKAENVIYAEALEDGIYACSGDRGVRTNVSLDRLAENQTFHCGFSVNPGKDDKFSMALCYRDAAGYLNYAFTPEVSVTAGKWTRVSESVVIPSGMTVYQMVICYNTNALGANGWKVTNPTLSLGSPVPLASSAHTPYATQDHVSVTYATKASLKVTDDSIKAEVTERGKLAGRVGTLESTSGTHTSKLEQLARSIKSLVKGESTYTDPDGASATSGIYSLVTQTRDSVTALFGSYTKTADLASTQAVKDAKKAGTDAQAAASAAQTTADSASSTAGAAKSTADSLATMVRQYSGGVLVCKAGQQVGALVNAYGSFDVADVTWDGETPTVGKTLMRLAKNSIEFNNPDTSYNICNITANGTLTNINVPNGSLAIDETPAWCQALGDSGYDSFIAGKMLQLGAGNRTTYSEILIEPDGTTIDGYKFALGTNNTTDTWVPVMGVNKNAGHLVHRVINLKWGPNAYAVYGAYNPNVKDHYYTTDVNEYNNLVKNGWTGNGVYFYAAK